MSQNRSESLTVGGSAYTVLSDRPAKVKIKSINEKGLELLRVPKYYHLRGELPYLLSGYFGIDDVFVPSPNHPLIGKEVAGEFADSFAKVTKVFEGKKGVLILELDRPIKVEDGNQFIEQYVVFSVRGMTFSRLSYTEGFTP